MWILILTILGYNSGAAIATVSNFKTQQQCEVARRTWLNSQSNNFDANWRQQAFTAVCVEQTSLNK